MSDRRVLAPGRGQGDEGAVPRVEVLDSLSGPATSLERPAGGPLREACDDAGAPVPFSCRSTSCGTCRVEVIEGAAWLDTAGADERAVLATFGDEPTTRRLACTAQLLAGDGLVRLRACEDW
ncbi:MAG: hypothetical protein NVSMB47_19380 [Polyangiales bacterium]